MMTQDIPPEIAKALAEVRRSFSGDLVYVINEIEEAKKLLGSSATLRAGLDKIAFEIHKISGVAGGIGFGELGDAAGDLDMRVKGLLRAGDPISLPSDLEDEIETVLDMMEDLIEF
ncbi:hypothetical protein [Shimia biformata]|uniref:hypothetical protein n=1 Tax=Shimia biformata TaxID=1294299 RepID=UPI0019521A22|nr:hypothetical protein [Shimia biformata]